MAIPLNAVQTDVDRLIDLFLSPDFNPETIDLSSYGTDEGFGYEAEAGEEVADGELEGGDWRHDEFFLKRCGRTLSKLGDEFQRSRPAAQAGPATSSPIDQMKEALEKAVQASETEGSNTQPSKETKERAWAIFKGVMENAVSDTVFKDAYQELGAFLMAIRGVRLMGEGVRDLARDLSLRYIRDRQLDQSIQRMGGMEALMAHELD
ncbi:uncharacterized protein LOC101847035 [Aplysia californica]|uniref:Uncharacterized protein LOC101847035 n=1 Tax=Aplysia californica TaxID=6500 RepID=A0ABM0JN03_APLCA|nr:uncharacterized protein LOC101847035 [Aplysia californica]XP_012937443.1 uncharacterized protein LOC101847035 [Aplysia californica]